MQDRIQELTKKIRELQTERDRLYELEIETIEDTYASYIGRTYRCPGTSAIYYRVIKTGGFYENKPAFSCLTFSNKDCWGQCKSKEGSRFIFGLGLNEFGIDNSITIEDLKSLEEIPFLEFKEAFDENCKRLLNLSDTVNKEN